MHYNFADGARFIAHEKEAYKHLNSITMQKNNNRDIMQKEIPVMQYKAVAAEDLW
jgi:hypothetical protein